MPQAQRIFAREICSKLEFCQGVAPLDHTLDAPSPPTSVLAVIRWAPKPPADLQKKKAGRSRILGRRSNIFSRSRLVHSPSSRCRPLDHTLDAPPPCAPGTSGRTSGNRTAGSDPAPAPGRRGRGARMRTSIASSFARTRTSHIRWRPLRSECSGRCSDAEYSL